MRAKVSIRVFFSIVFSMILLTMTAVALVQNHEDFTQGALSNLERDSNGDLKLAGDEVRGDYTSRIIDAGSNARWKSLGWEEDLPTSTEDIYFVVRSCDDPACEGESFSTEVRTMDEPFDVPDNRYFQYKAILEGAGGGDKYDYETTTPILYSVFVDYEIIRGGEVGPAVVEHSAQTDLSGAFDRTEYDEKIQLMSGYTQGTYTSPAIDAGSDIRWDALTWEEELPAGTDIYFKVRSCDDRDCSGESFSEWDVIMMEEALGVPDNRYFQYKAYLITEDIALSPSLYSVSVHHTGTGEASEPSGPSAPPEPPSPPETSQPAIECTDSDGIADPFLRGTTYGMLEGSYETMTDACVGDTLTEYYCVGSEIHSDEYACEYGCEDGACKRGESVIVALLNRILAFFERLFGRSPP